MQFNNRDPLSKNEQIDCVAADCIFAEQTLAQVLSATPTCLEIICTMTCSRLRFHLNHVYEVPLVLQ